MALHMWVKADLTFPSHIPGQAAQLKCTQHQYGDSALNVLFILHSLANSIKNTPLILPGTKKKYKN